MSAQNTQNTQIGHLEGAMTLYHTNGIIKYRGHLQGGVPHGLGKLYRENGDFHFVGEFKDGKPHGQGKYYYSNGDTYEGIIINGKRNGYGRYFSNNWIYQAIFIDNRIDKVGQIYRDNILYYAGEIRNDKPHGFGTKYNTNNTVKYRGMFFDGKFQITFEGVAYDDDDMIMF